MCKKHEENFICRCFCLYGPVLTIAQQNGGSPLSTEESRSIMDDVSRRNKAYETLTAHDDTLMRRVVAYYDEHGTANERMEAYYLLGSVQRDLHDAPKAMKAE